MAYEAFSGWAVVEIMGRQTYAGFCSEQSVAGSVMLRVDVPEQQESVRCPHIDAYTKLFGASSIYSVTPCSEEIVRRVLAQDGRPPFYFYDEEQKALPAPCDDGEEDGDSFGRWNGE
jgi:hypothetical protein